MPKRFALIGAAGYVAPRHMEAIKKTGNVLVAALDPRDSVGVIDGYFQEADFFVEFERFDRHIEKLRRKGEEHRIDYVSVCSPNYLHDAHIRFGLRVGADVICEKPLVLNPWNIDALAEIERESGRSVYTILQLRLHPSIIALHNRFALEPKERKHDVELTYITARGHWYLVSWKGDERKSGGVATNIGIHFFDMLHFLFGAPQENIVHYKDPQRAGGYLEFERARVRWFLSTAAEDLPPAVRDKGRRAFRSITIDGEEVEFSGGFEDLHLRSYEHVLAGGGFGMEACRTAIDLVAHIRDASLQGVSCDRHPLLSRRLVGMR